jgi:hypothetical protein
MHFQVATFRRTQLRSLLEKAIVHLLNGDDEKAAALFHKFMVERARQIHESLRQDGSEDNLDENWDSEIKEEEYFDDNELGDDASSDDPSMAGDSPIDGGGDIGAEPGPPDAMGAPDDGMGDDPDANFGDPDEGGEPGIEGKIDDLTDKIDQLTSEFDRVMSEFHDDGDDANFGDPSEEGGGDDDGLGLDGDVPSDDTGSDFGGDDDTGGDNTDLAGRMEDDMGDDHEPVAEGEMPDFIKDKMKKKKDDAGDKDDEGADDEEIDESDELSDITESVLAELDRIAPPSMTAEVKGVGSNSVKSQLGAGNTASPVPHHNVMDRVKGEPVMTKGPTHKGYAKEESPTVAGADTLVKNVRPENRRKSFKDTMKTIPPNGDGAALINKDFAPGMPKPTKSIIDGKTSKG